MSVVFLETVPAPEPTALIEVNRQAADRADFAQLDGDFPGDLMPDPDQVYLDPRDLPESLEDTSSRWVDIERVLGTLNLIDRSVLVLRAFHDLKYSDVGKNFGFTGGRARQLGDRALWRCFPRMIEESTVDVNGPPIRFSTPKSPEFLMQQDMKRRQQDGRI